MRIGTGRNGWTIWHLPTCLGLAVIGLLVTFDVWADIALIAFRDEESSHIFLVPIIAAWLVWIRRSRMRYCRAGSSMIGPAMIAMGWIIYSLGYYNAIQAFWHGGGVLVVVGCVVTILGRDILLRFFPVFIVLVFLVPVPGMARQELALPLQTATAMATQFVFDFLNADVERIGNVLSINGVNVAIAEACNGMRMVFALVLVSFAFAFGTPLRMYVRVLILVASPVSAIVCNVIRLVPTIWLYGYYPAGVADNFHDISGWLMLPVAFMALLTIIRLLRWALIPVSHYTLAYD